MQARSSLAGGSIPSCTNCSASKCYAMAGDASCVAPRSTSKFITRSFVASLAMIHVEQSDAADDGN